MRPIIPAPVIPASVIAAPELINHAGDTKTMIGRIKIPDPWEHLDIRSGVRSVIGK
jgi:hypothetical protein